MWRNWMKMTRNDERDETVCGRQKIDQERMEARQGPRRDVRACCGRSGGKEMGVRCLWWRWKGM